MAEAAVAAAAATRAAGCAGCGLIKRNMGPWVGVVPECGGPPTGALDKLWRRGVRMALVAASNERLGRFESRDAQRLTAETVLLCSLP